MVSALFSGLSGIKTNQTSMDVIGNNIANINTPAFKAGRALFSDAFSSMLASGTSPSNRRGGLNPLQVGHGVIVSAIDNLFTQGSPETTGKSTDLAIEGDGFFILRDGDDLHYTRDGSFDLDANGLLVDPATGFAVQGRMADSSGEIPSSTPVTDIVIPMNTLFPAEATSNVAFTGNLDSTATIADPATGTEAETYDNSVFVYDSLGNMHSVTLNFERTASNTWQWTASVDGNDTIAIWQGDPPAETATGALTFTSDGVVDTGGEAELRISGSGGAGNPLEDGASEMTINLDLSGLAQYARDFTPVPSYRDGYGACVLDNVNIDETGTIVGIFTNGATQTLGQILLSDFHNPSGLTKIGENLYNASMNSGPALVGTAGGSVKATIISGAIETSNVDLANEFTRMIIAQRGFEANSKLVTTSDSMLGDVINLKR